MVTEIAPERLTFPHLNNDGPLGDVVNEKNEKVIVSK